MRIFFPYLRCVITLAACLAIVAQVSAAETDPDGRQYASSADPLADVHAALVRAKSADRRLLVVLGANWCHDSRALAARLGHSPLAELIQQHYERVFVDVGYYENGRDVVQHFGVANYYATPTVLIVDPASGLVINNKDRHQWGSAYRIDMSASVQYFEKWSRDDQLAETAPDSAEFRNLMLEIDNFELQQANRVAAGYAVVGPMLEATDAGNEPEEFDARWNELRKFRSAIPRDVRELRDDARHRVTAGEQDVELEWPAYSSLSWESE
jgi:thiol-disulfide isomerase/thioredoxin